MSSFPLTTVIHHKVSHSFMKKYTKDTRGRRENSDKEGERSDASYLIISQIIRANVFLSITSRIELCVFTHTVSCSLPQSPCPAVCTQLAVLPFLKDTPSSLCASVHDAPSVWDALPVSPPPWNILWTPPLILQGTLSLGKSSLWPQSHPSLTVPLEVQTSPQPLITGHCHHSFTSLSTHHLRTVLKVTGLNEPLSPRHVTHRAWPTGQA